jgi:hypothetical protein
LSPEEKVAVELKVRAFSQGFAIGANLLKQANRHTVDPDTHEHWRRGFDLGRKSADAAANKYRESFRGAKVT